jgi:hypothetical protein
MGYRDRPRGPSFARVFGTFSIAAAIALVVLIAAAPANAQSTPTAEQPIDEPSSLHAVIKRDGSLAKPDRLLA